MLQFPDASTLDELTDAIDPNLDYRSRDMIQLYYLFGTTAIKFVGGADGIRTRFEFLSAWVDFIRNNNLGHMPVTYDVAYEFTSGLVSDYGADYLQTLFRGLSGFVPYGYFVDPTDELGAEKLALAFSGM